MILALLACTGGVFPDVSTPTAAVPSTTADASRERLQALLAGDPDAAYDLSWSVGFPVPVDDTYAFVFEAGANDACALTGDFNGWTEQPMQRTGSWWHHSEPARSFDDGLRYKIVCNDGLFRADPLARAFDYDDFGEISFVRPPDDGHLERWPQMPSAGLQPHDLTVWVPAHVAGPYDVLYAADGQNLFAPDAINGGWRLQQALEGRPVLVVGIHNTVDRMAEYSHVDDHVLDMDVTATGDAYASFVHEQVRPHIEASYPTSGHDGLIGSSLGGLISLHIAQSHPGAYDFVASLSGTLGWGRFGMQNPTMQERWLADAPDLVVYADSGGGPGADGLCTDPDGDGSWADDPDASDNYCTTRQFVDALADQGFSWDEDLFHWHEPGAPHSEAAWAARVHRPLAIFAD